MKKESINKFWIIAIFAIAMAFLEATVIIYLRKIYYPLGFDFPLKGFIDSNIMGIEWVREFFTIVMLLSVALLASKKFYKKFAYFIYAFAIWDIFYYVFLKLTLNWPPSFLTWDILFLIPLPWIGPVITPVLFSILMLSLAFLIIYFEDKGKNVKITLKELCFFIMGVLLILYTWLYDYVKIIFSNGFVKDFFTLAENQQFTQVVSSYVPLSYNWPLFITGIALIILGIILFYLRTSRD